VNTSSLSDSSPPSRRVPDKGNIGDGPNGKGGKLGFLAGSYLKFWAWKQIESGGPWSKNILENKSSKDNMEIEFLKQINVFMRIYYYYDFLKFQLLSFQKLPHIYWKSKFYNPVLLIPCFKEANYLIPLDSEKSYLIPLFILSWPLLV
jgi:hypothetical protein